MNIQHKDDNIFDAQGYRYNIGIIILNSEHRVFWAKRRGQNAWQFPQGGVSAGESCLEAMYRELFEETGIERASVDLLGATDNWLRYKLPVRYRRRVKTGTQCIGQKQRWYLLRLQHDGVLINLSATDSQEFERWRWVDYWSALEQVVYFKRDVYAQAMHELAELVPQLKDTEPAVCFRRKRNKVRAGS